MSAFEELRRLSAIFTDCARQSAALVRNGTLSQALDKITFSTNQFVQLWKHATPTARDSFNKAADLKGEERQASIRKEVAHDFQDAVVKTMLTFEAVADMDATKVPDRWKPIIIQDTLGLAQMLSEIVSNYRVILGNNTDAVEPVLRRYETELIPALPQVGEALAAEFGIPAAQLPEIKAKAYAHVTQGSEHIGLLPPNFK